MSKGENMLESDLKRRMEAQWNGPLLHPAKPFPWVQRGELGNVVSPGYELPALRTASIPNEEGEGR